MTFCQGSFLKLSLNRKSVRLRFRSRTASWIVRFWSPTASCFCAWPGMLRRWARVLIPTFIVQHAFTDADACQNFSCSRVGEGEISCDALWSDICAAHGTDSLRVRAVCPNECPPPPGADIEPWQVCRAMLFATDPKMEQADQFTSAQDSSSSNARHPSSTNHANIEHPAGATRRILGACADDPDAAAKILKISSGLFPSCGGVKNAGQCSNAIECGLVRTDAILHDESSAHAI